MRTRTLAILVGAFVAVGIAYAFFNPEAVSKLGQWASGPGPEASGSVGNEATGASVAEGAGRLEAREFDLATETGGQILSISAEEGDTLAKGAVAAVIDAREIEATLQRAEAEHARALEFVAEAEASLAQGTADVGLADAQLRRATTLRDRQAISGADTTRR